MSDPIDVAVKVMTTVPTAYAELHAEIMALPSRKRSKRLAYLAQMGLLYTQGLISVAGNPTLPQGEPRRDVGAGGHVPVVLTAQPQSESAGLQGNTTDHESQSAILKVEKPTDESSDGDSADTSTQVPPREGRRARRGFDPGKMLTNKAP